MRILVDAHVFDGFYHGSRSYLKGLYNAIVDLEAKNPTGIKFFFAARDIDRLRENFGSASCVEYVPLKSNGSAARLLIEFPSIMRRYKIDYAHFQYIVPWSKPCKFIVTIHDLIFLDNPEYYGAFYRYSRKLLFGMAFRRSEIVTTVSEYSKRQLHQLFGRKSIPVIGNAVDTNLKEFRVSRTKEEWLKEIGNRDYLLYVSRFEPRKNHYSLLKAYADGAFHLTHDLMLIGHKTLPCEDFERLLQELPEDIRKNVFIINDPIPTNLLFHYISFADLFVYPSSAEGFGLPPIEAAALGTPVICSNNTAMEDFDFLEDGHINTGSSGVIQAAIQRKLQQPAPDREAQCERIRNYVMQHYDWSESAKKWRKAIFEASQDSKSD